jgi:hypothetical protein
MDIVNLMKAMILAAKIVEVAPQAQSVVMALVNMGRIRAIVVLIVEDV